MKVREVNLVDSGDGSTMAAYASAYPATVSSLMNQVNASLGVDLKGILSGNNDRSLSAPVPPNAPAPIPTPTTIPAGPASSEGGHSW
jgi:hypothetical protein